LAQIWQILNAFPLTPPATIASEQNGDFFFIIPARGINPRAIQRTPLKQISSRANFIEAGVMHYFVSPISGQKLSWP
jgi:hypothetical protein